MRVVLVDLESDVDNLAYLMCAPRFGLSVIGARLDRAGHDVTILADAYGPVTVDEVLDLEPAALLVNGIQTTTHRVEELVSEVRRRRPGVPVILGGEEATIDPTRGRRFADFVIPHEGDEAIVELVAALAAGGGGAGAGQGVPGVHRRVGDTWEETPPRASRLARIAYRANPRLYRGLEATSRSLLARLTSVTPAGRLIYFPIQTSRGCDRACAFCSWVSLFGGGGYRERPIDDVLADIDQVLDYTGQRHFMVVDNLFGKHRPYATELARRLIRRHARARRPKLTVLMRADQFAGEDAYADEELRLLGQAGFRDISLGLESLNERTLRAVGKGTTVALYRRAIGRLTASGLRVLGTFGVGGGDDERADLDRIVDFAHELGLYRLHLYAYTVTPGAPSFAREGHLAIPGLEPRFANGHGVTTLPRRMLPTELQDGLLASMGRFHGWLSEEGFLYKRKLASIARSLAPHRARLERLERRLVAEGVYVRRGHSWILDEEGPGAAVWARVAADLR